MCIRCSGHFYLVRVYVSETDHRVRGLYALRRRVILRLGRRDFRHHRVYMYTSLQCGSKNRTATIIMT